MTKDSRREYQKYNMPDEKGYFGTYGGKFVPELLMPALSELESAYRVANRDPRFTSEFNYYLNEFVGRPTRLTFAERLTNHYRRAQIWLKREDLCHTGAHKINNAVGQVLLAQRMNKKRIIAETGAGQHGVAVATACARFGLECIVYMGSEDMERQKLNVERMKLLGAKVRPVESGSRTLKDATNEAIRDWVTHVESTFYVIGSVVGPHPYPMMVRNFQTVIGQETKRQLEEKNLGTPDILVASVGGGSNAIGFFYPFIEERQVRMIGVEASGLGLQSGKTAATLTLGRPGVLHGTRSYLLQDGEGQVKLAHSVSAGLDYPGVGPEHAWLYDQKRAEYVSVTDEEALKAVELLSRKEGIIPALESAHALAWLETLMPQTVENQIVVLNLSGRGDKDMRTIAEHLDRESRGADRI